MAKKYIFLFTITPVQSFILEARKTRDLFAGSQILSEVTKKAVNLTKNRGAEIIIPSGDLEKAHSISNKFVAIFRNIEEENLENIGRNIEFKTWLYWKNEIANETLKKNEESSKEPFLKSCNSKDFRQFISKFNDHITKYFNIYWLFYPINNSYEIAYKEAEKYLRAIKNVRCFEQFDTEENHRKCSICGERDAIIYQDIKFTGKNKIEPPFAYKNSLLLPDSYIIEKNEGLCGICFIKRFYYEGEKFPSTAEISLLNVFNGVSPELIKKLIDYKNLFKKGNLFNEQLYYEENLSQKYFKEHYLDENILPIVKIKLQDIYNLVRNENIPITRYYALIKFDGDNMGKWLSGDFLKEKDKLQDFHKKLSNKLREFAKYAKSYLDNGKGKTVYAGGDDFLGFINLVYLFEVLEKLREEFDRKVNKSLKNKFELEEDLTFSSGIVIAHYKDPLILVLDWANKMEDEAKHLEGKNAFGIAVLKRSGEIRKAVYKWDKLKYIQEIYKSIIEDEEFNSSFITKLEESFKKIPFEHKEFYEKKGKDLIKADLKRILKKSSNIKNKNKLNIKIKNVIVIFSKLIYAEIKNFFEILNILKFIEKEL